MFVEQKREILSASPYSALPHKLLAARLFPHMGPTTQGMVILGVQEGLQEHSRMQENPMVPAHLHALCFGS